MWQHCIIDGAENKIYWILDSGGIVSIYKEHIQMELIVMGHHMLSILY